MQQRPFTLRVFFPHGDPDGVRIIEDHNWTGQAICLSRDDVSEPERLKEIGLESQAGLYFLIGDIDPNISDSEHSNQIYVGETDNLLGRLSTHASKSKGKDFWYRAICFLSTKGTLNKAHCLWIEHRLIERAKSVNATSLQNNDNGSDPNLTLSEQADCDFFLEKIYQILPLAGISAFEEKQIVKSQTIVRPKTKTKSSNANIKNMLVVPARDSGFNDVFLDENCWHAIRIHKDRQADLTHIAAYRVGKIRAITHYAEIKEIVPIGSEGKFKVNFKKPAIALDNPIKYRTGIDATLQASRYARSDKLFSAKNLAELFEDHTKDASD